MRCIYNCKYHLGMTRIDAVLKTDLNKYGRASFFSGIWGLSITEQKIRNLLVILVTTFLFLKDQGIFFPSTICAYSDIMHKNGTSIPLITFHFKGVT